MKLGWDRVRHLVDVSKLAQGVDCPVISQGSVDEYCLKENVCFIEGKQIKFDSKLLHKMSSQLFLTHTVWAHALCKHLKSASQVTQWVQLLYWSKRSALQNWAQHHCILAAIHQSEVKAANINYFGTFKFCRITAAEWQFWIWEVQPVHWKWLGVSKDGGLHTAQSNIFSLGNGMLSGEKGWWFTVTSNWLQPQLVWLFCGFTVNYVYGITVLGTV